MKSNPKAGFSQEAELLVHYQLIDEGYQPVTTSSELIKKWLTDNNLTWQKGFPSKSECKGQEGQLIPDMHDPLLNDPDVLK